MTTKEEIAKVLEKIAENEAVARAELPPVPFGDIVTYQRQRMMAADTANDLKQQYLDYVVRHLGVIVLEGNEDKQKEFAKLAAKVGNTVTYDSLDLYRKMTGPAFGMTGGTGNLSADQLVMIFSEIRLKCRTELDIFRLKDPETNWMFQYAWNSNNDLADAIRKSIWISNGILFTNTDFLKFVKQECLTKPVARTTIPVVFIGMQPEEKEAFLASFTHGYIIVNVDDTDTVNEKFVTDAFKSLKNVIKTKKDMTSWQTGKISQNQEQE